MTAISQPAVAPHPGVATAATVASARRWDPRLYQIATLTCLLTYGVLRLDLEVQAATAVAIITTALITQALCTRLARRGRVETRSALISALSLCLLLRTSSVELAVLTAVVAIASKFVLRVGDKHVFNPTNGALVAMMLVTREIWVSPGQWGSGVVFAFVLFAFFMISDPKTTPDSRVGRLLFAALVALGAYVVQFWLFRTDALLWSLAVCSLAVPIIDRLLPGSRYQWRTSS